jgi:VWFA-related protein
MSRSFLRTAIGVTAIALASVAPGAWQQNPPQQRPPVFRGEAVLVTVDAYPQIDGRIVEGLKADDFQLFEDGKPQAIDSLEFVRVEPSLSEGERRDPNTVGEMLQMAADPHNRVFVVFLDRLHVSVDGSFATRRPMVDALNRIIGPDDLYGVMTQDTEPRALTLGRRSLSVEEQLTKHWTWGERHRITVDPNDPLEDGLKSCYEYKPPSPKEPLMPWYVDDNGQRRLLFEVLIDRRREDRTLLALERLVDRLAGMREARTVALLVTEGWRLFGINRGLANEAGVYGATRPPIGSSGGRVTLGDRTQRPETMIHPQQCQDELVRLANLDNERRFREIIRRANQANVTFYPINPSGLPTFDTPPTFGRPVAEVGATGPPQVKTLGPPDLAEDGNRLALRTGVMRTLAENTDGIAIVNTNDLSAGMKRIVDDVSAYYLLGYYSTNTTHDGRYRRIEVKTTKMSNVRMRARRGYFAPSNKPERGASAIPPGPAAAEPPKGLENALAELSRLRVSADVFARGAISGREALVAVEIGTARAAATPWSAGATAQVVLTPDGRGPLAPVTGAIEPGARGVLIAVPLDAAAATARVVVRVSAAREVLEDTAELRLAAPGPVSEAIVYRGRPAATSPLRPVADLQFRRTERVHIEWIVAGELDERSTRLLGKNGQPLPIPVTMTERDSGGRKVIAADLNLAPLSAGEYVIELTAGRAGASVVRLVAFRVTQ